MKQKFLLNFKGALFLFLVFSIKSFAQPTLGEIRLFAGNYPPTDWAICNGQSLSISENSALYTLLGTTYGGDGINTFNLPDLRGRVVIGRGQGPTLGNYIMGQTGGTEIFRITALNLPAHSHAVNIYNAVGNVVNAQNNALARNRTLDLNSTNKGYTNNAPNTLLNVLSISATGRNSDLENTQPSIGITHIIALYGVYPSHP